MKVDWVITDIEATYASSKVWDPDQMKWVETKTATVADKTAEFTFTNYSSVIITAKVSFTAETELASTLTSAVFRDDESNDVTTSGVDLDTCVDYTDHSVDSAKTGTNAPSETITGTLTFDATEFGKLSAQSTAAKYGTYTVLITDETPV